MRGKRKFPGSSEEVVRPILIAVLDALMACSCGSKDPDNVTASWLVSKQRSSSVDARRSLV
jgi:hypothetical protein